MFIEQPPLVLQGSVSRGNLADSGKEEVCISHLRRWSDPRGYPLGIGYIRQIWREGDLLLCRGQRPQTSGHLPDGTGQGHRVGNHTFNHIQGIRFWTKNYLANVEKAAE